MRAPPAAWLETLALAALMTVGLEGAIGLRLRTAGDERRQPVDAAAVPDRYRLRLRLILRLRPMMVAVVVAGLMVLARLIGLAFALLVARYEWLRLGRGEAWLLAEMRKALGVLLAVLRRHLVLGAG